MRYRFKDLEIDEEAFAIRRGEILIDLEPRVFELLVYLIRSRPRMVTKGELLQHVWRGYSVGDGVLARGICVARGTLNCRDAIRTIHGRGYQWIAAVSEEDSI
jgi:DNA-binding winged helix-turn-helix (wHTH) protein